MKRKPRKPKARLWPPPIVCIEWLDAYGGGKGGEWLEIAKLQDPPVPLLIRSVGFLIHDGPDAKRIMASLTDRDHPEASYGGDGEMVIEAKSIVKMVQLRPAGGNG